MKLFCIPYAGGNSWAYRGLERCLAPDITVVGLELPGRGRRTGEPLASSLEQMADDVYAQLHDRLDHDCYAFYGHSMGALIARLAAGRIQEHGGRLPRALFVSGCEAPSAQTARRRHALPPDEFVDMLREMGGCPPEVLANPELLTYFEPVIRADFLAVEQWAYKPAAPLDVPIVVMIGSHDDVSEAAAQRWSIETKASFRMTTFAGDHFFILQHWTAIADLIRRQLIDDSPATARPTPSAE